MDHKRFSGHSKGSTNKVSEYDKDNFQMLVKNKIWQF
ncbi:MAG: hypothetical protein ACI8Q1_001733 [Parvicella sp.]|jgi:hypothetical protein